MSYDSRADDTMDDGFEGLENVRACCNGKHDVGMLSRHHDHGSRPPSRGPMGGSRPPSRGALTSSLSSIYHDVDSNSSMNMRQHDSPSVRASNINSLRNRLGGAVSPASYSGSIKGKSSTILDGTKYNSVANSSPSGTISSQFGKTQRKSQLMQDLGILMQDKPTVERLDTPPPRASSRLSRKSISTTLSESLRGRAGG
ncbi:hypothetical protein DFH28DRAFT_892876 [Melampsora americana]|nr:hypothetical protein DFH28DRAFT_892876 [Melampsora americana]